MGFSVKVKDDSDKLRFKESTSHYLFKIPKIQCNFMKDSHSMDKKCLSDS